MSGRLRRSARTRYTAILPVTPPGTPTESLTKRLTDRTFVRILRGWAGRTLRSRGVELERRLSGRAEPNDRDEFAGDGGDSPAWSRKRGPYIPATDARPFDGDVAPVRYAELHAHSSFSFLDGASAPEELVEEAAGSAFGPHPDRPRRLLRHRPVRRGRRRARVADGVRGRTVAGIALPRTSAERMVAARVGVPDPTGHHLLVLARDPAGYASLARRSAPPSLRGGAKGRPVYDALNGRAGRRHWLVLSGCRKGSVRTALAARGPRPRPGAPSPT